MSAPSARKATFDWSKLPPAKPGETGDPAHRFVRYLYDSSSGPKFLFDDIYHFSLKYYDRNKGQKTLLPLVKFMLATVLERVLNLEAPFIMRPEVITSFFENAKRHEKRVREAREGHLTIYRLAEILSQMELAPLTAIHKNAAMGLIDGFSRLFPDHAVLSPTGMEAMLKVVMSDPGFTNGQPLRDEDFEAFWMAICYIADLGGFASNAAWSRNGNFETFPLFMMQYGILPFRDFSGHDAMTITMPGKEQAEPCDYLKMIFAHLQDVVPQGFTSDLSLKMAVRVLMLEDMRRERWTHKQWPLDQSRVSRALKNLGPEHDAKFDEVRRNLINFIEARNIAGHLNDPVLEEITGHGDVDGVADFYRTRCLPDADPQIKTTGYRGKDYQQEARDMLDMAKALSKDGGGRRPKAPPYELEGKFLHVRERLMPDDSFGAMPRDQSLAVKALVGLWEIVRPPLDGKESIFLFVNPRGGQIASEYAAKHGIAVPGEARGIGSAFDENANDENASFERVVRDPTIKKSRRIEKHLRALYPKSPVFSVENAVDPVGKVFERSRAAIATGGSKEMGGEAKAAFAQELVRRRTTMAVFDHAWETDGFLTRERIYCRKIQLGLVERPEHLSPYDLQVKDVAGNPDWKHKKLFTTPSLVDDLLTLTACMRKMVAAETQDYPADIVRGLLETVAMINLYYNENLSRAANPDKDNSRLIDWEKVDIAVKGPLDDANSQPLIQDALAEAKELIRRHGIVSLDRDYLSGQLEIIDPDYKKARVELEQRQKLAATRSPRPSYCRGP
jgi:hypothetical protein